MLCFNLQVQLEELQGQTGSGGGGGASEADLQAMTDKCTDLETKLDSRKGKLKAYVFS